MEHKNKQLKPVKTKSIERVLFMALQSLVVFILVMLVSAQV